MKNKVLYFGYGANRSSDMMEAIIGRKPTGFQAKLDNYELFIQKWNEIPEEVRERLSGSWDKSFRTYCIRPAKGKLVIGKVWFLTKKERKLISNWEFWYKPIKVFVGSYRGREEVETEMINDPNIGQIVDGKDYQMFLGDKVKMLQIADLSRKKYLKQIK